MGAEGAGSVWGEGRGTHRELPRGFFTVGKGFPVLC